MTIGVIGLGYVGLTLSMGAALRGITVYGIEKNLEILECLSNNQAHFYEPGLNELLEANINKNFFFSSEFPQEIKYDAFIVTVGTPLKEDEKIPNFDYIKTALETLKDVYTGKELIVLRSTVSVGTTRKIVIPWLQKISEKEEVYVSMCPERTVEGVAVKELLSLPQIVSGNNNKALQYAKQLFQIITDDIVEVSSIEEAELIKLYNNVYRDMTFALGNAFCMAAQTFGVNGNNIIKYANMRYKRSDIKLPGFVSGPCLEKDAYLLINNMIECEEKNFILSGRHINENIVEKVIMWIERVYKEKKYKKCIVLSGMAFKGTPETSDLRGSSSVIIAKRLIELGYSLRIHDYIVSEKELKKLDLGHVIVDLSEACDTDASMLLILNNNVRYKTLSEDDIRNKNIEILDVWDVCEKLKGSDFIINTLGTIWLRDKV